MSFAIHNIVIPFVHTFSREEKRKEKKKTNNSVSCQYRTSTIGMIPKIVITSYETFIVHNSIRMNEEKSDKKNVLVVK